MHTRRSTRLLLLALLAIAGLTTSSAQTRPAAPAAASDVPRIAFEKFTLPNGLDVILRQDRRLPVVAVDLWYHVGPANEEPGRTGFAHLFEHMMFQCSKHVPCDSHFKLLEAAGASDINGTTDYDRTNYFETLPANQLELALWLESDRMGYLLDKLDQMALSNQQDVVRNERRQSVENQPYGLAEERLVQALFPKGHPYYGNVIGSHEDIQAAKLADVQDFFKRYYVPNNASLAIVGDFEPAQAKAWVAKYFAPLPRGKAIARPAVAPAALTAPRRLVYEDRVQVPRLYVQWPSVGVKSDDTYALRFLAQLLTGSRTARLTKALVYDRQSAATVRAGQDALENAGTFGITVTPRPGNTLAALEASVDSVIDRLKREGPTAEEMARASAGLEFAFVSSLESNLGKAEILNTGAVFHKDPGYFRTQYAKMRAVTPADVRRVAARYLGPNRVVLSVVPLGKSDLASNAAASTKVTVSTDGGHYIMESK